MPVASDPAERARLVVMDANEGTGSPRDSPPGRPPRESADMMPLDGAGGIDALRERLARLERSVPAGLRNLPEEVGREAKPAWSRVTQGETRWQVSLAVIAAIALQLPVPDRLALVRPGWLLPALEALLMLGLVIANPHRIDRESVILR